MNAVLFLKQTILNEAEFSNFMISGSTPCTLKWFIK